MQCRLQRLVKLRLHFLGRYRSVPRVRIGLAGPVRRLRHANPLSEGWRLPGFRWQVELTHVASRGRPTPVRFSSLQSSRPRYVMERRNVLPEPKSWLGYLDGVDSPRFDAQKLCLVAGSRCPGQHAYSGNWTGCSLSNGKLVSATERTVRFPTQGSRVPDDAPIAERRPKR